MTEISRRLVLGSAVGGAAVSLLPPSLHTAMAQPVRRGGLRAIEHVIVLMQENRSFDHYYGTLRGVRGYGDRQPLRLRDGKSVFHQPVTGGGEVLPFSIRKAAADAGRNPDDIQYLGALAHGYSDATQAWANGWHDNWVQAKTSATMTHYERRDIPLQYELAETFTICDAYHCSVNGSTNPNRNYLWSGTTGYEPGTTQRAVTNAAYSYDHAGYDWTSYPERLEKAGVSWQIYQEWDNFTDNAVEYFKTFKELGHRILAGVPGGYRTTEEFYDKLFAKLPDERATALKELDTAVEKLPIKDQKLFRKALYRSGAGVADPAAPGRHQGRDAAAGQLAGAVRGRLRAPRIVHAGRQREPRLRPARRDRVRPGDLVEDRAADQLRRERRVLRPRPAAGRAAACHG